MNVISRNYRIIIALICLLVIIYWLWMEIAETRNKLAVICENQANFHKAWGAHVAYMDEARENLEEIQIHARQTAKVVENLRDETKPDTSKSWKFWL